MESQPSDMMEHEDDELMATVEALFKVREVQGLITSEQLMEIFAEIQIPFDVAILERTVPEDKWDALPLMICRTIVQRHMSNSQRVEEEAAAAEGPAVTVAKSNVTIVHLDTLPYLWSLLPCVEGEEGVEYRRNSINFELRPRTLLMLTVGATVLISAGILILAIILLNEAAVESHAKSSLNLMSIVTEVADKTLRNEAVLFLGSTLDEVVATSRDAVNDMALVLNQLASEQLSISASVVSALLSSITDDVFDDAWTTVNDTLTAMVELLVISNGGVSEASRLCIASDGYGRYSFLLNADGSLLQTSPSCGSATLNLSSVISVLGTSGVVGFGDTPCGGRGPYAIQYIPSINLYWALFVETTVKEVLSDVETFVTGLNNAVANTTYNMEFGVRTDSDPIFELGDRNIVSVVCILVGSCDRNPDPLQEAVDSPMNFTGQLSYVDKALQPITAAIQGYESQTVKFGLVVSREKKEIFSPLFASLSATSPTLTERQERAEIYPMYANKDFTAAPVLLSPNTTLDAQEADFLLQAVANRTGLQIPQSLDSDIAAYSFMQDAQIGVAMVLGASAHRDTVIADSLGFVQNQNLILPSGRGTYVYSKTLFGEYNEVLQRNCTGHCNAASQRGFATQSSGTMDAVLETGAHVHARYRYDSDTDTVFVTFVTRKVLNDQVLPRRWMELGLGLGITLLTFVAVLYMTTRAVRRIEADYDKYKFHIEEEKRQFSELVKDIMPGYIAEKIMKGTRLIAETHPMLTFFFSDMVGSTESTKALTNKQLIRLLGYHFMLEDTVAAFYKIHKVKTIGDAYFAVAGLEDSTLSPANGEDHQVFRMVSFACVTQQLLSPVYAHYPEETECFRISADKQDLGPFKPVRLRIGIHTGSAIAGVLDVGRAPHFDCFGPAVNLASRMESSGLPSRVQISGPTMEALVKVDKNGLFEFEAPRKTLVKGYGTMNTYIIRSSGINVPTEIIERLHIKRATHRQYFVEGNSTPNVDQQHLGAGDQGHRAEPQAVPKAVVENFSSPSGPINVPEIAPLPAPRDLVRPEPPKSPREPKALPEPPVIVKQPITMDPVQLPPAPPQMTIDGVLPGQLPDVALSVPMFFAGFDIGLPPPPPPPPLE